METRTEAMNALQTGLRYLVDERHVISGMALAYGTPDCAETLAYGRAQEVTLEAGAFVPAERALHEDAMFDLASVTKLFTALSVLQLRDAGKLSLSDTVRRFDKRFYGIADVTVYDLMAFQAALSSPERIDAQPDAEQAERNLFALRPSPRPKWRFYTDMGAMVLKYVVEAASGVAFETYIKENILSPLGMMHTGPAIPAAALPHAVCYDFERRFEGGEYRLDTACPCGTVHDKKARILGRTTGLCGHAGLFSTIGDMTLLAQGLLRGEVVRRETLCEMGVSRTGERLPDGSYTQYLGFLCFTKHPVQTYSEVPACFSDGAVALNGYTGNHFSVDPAQNHFMILLANKIHNRVTVANGRPDPFDPTETFLWNDGIAYPVSQNYTYLKDAHIKAPIAALYPWLPCRR